VGSWTRTWSANLDLFPGRSKNVNSGEIAGGRTTRTGHPLSPSIKKQYDAASAAPEPILTPTPYDSQAVAVCSPRAADHPPLDPVSRVAALLLDGTPSHPSCAGVTSVSYRDSFCFVQFGALTLLRGHLTKASRSTWCFGGPNFVSPSSKRLTRPENPTSDRSDPIERPPISCD
jgi:hypothetical protein